MVSSLRLHGVAALLLATFLPGQALWAQETKPEEAGALSEVVVTAQARVQRDQDVPIALTAIDAGTFQQQGIRQIEDVAVFIPDVFFSDSTSLSTPTTMIRGLGTSGSNAGFEQAVPMFIDGIHFGRAAQTESALLDVEQLAVLKGPQPIYFGMNATAGAISITTKKPGKLWEGYVLGESGNDNIKKGEFGVGGPVTDTFGIRIAGKYESTDGWLHDTITGQKYPSREDWAGRVSAVWQPLDVLQFAAKFEKSAVHQSSVAEQVVGCTPRANSGCGVLLAGTTFHYPAISGNIDNLLNDGGNIGSYLRVPMNPFLSYRNVSANFLDLRSCAACTQLGRAQYPTNGYLDIDYDAWHGIKLTSKTGYSQFWKRFQDDFDGTPFLLDNLWRNEHLKQYSEELRVISPSGGMLEWVAGAYWEREDLTAATISIDPTLAGNPPQDRLNGNNYSEHDRWLSGFAAATLNFLDRKVAIDAGGRYTDVTKEGDAYCIVGHYILAPGQTLGPNGVVDGMTALTRGRGTKCSGNLDGGIEDQAPFHDSDFNPQVVLRYRPFDALSLYAKWATAFKAGGFVVGSAQVQPIGQFVFGSEHATIYEAGAKSSFLGGRLTADLALFSETYRNLQVSVTDPIALINETKNAGKARSRGVEIETHLAATEHLTLGLSAAYDDARYLQFDNASCNVQEVANGACAKGYISRAGQPLPFAPQWQTTQQLTYWVPIRHDMKVSFNGALNVSAGSVTNDTYDNTIMWRAHTTLNLNLSLGDLGDRWQLSLWGRNITQPTQTYNGHPQDPYFYTTVVSPLRTYGIQGKYQF